MTNRFLRLLTCGLLFLGASGGLDSAARLAAASHPQPTEAAVAEPLIDRVSTATLKRMMETEGNSVSINDRGNIVWKVEGLTAIMLIYEGEQSIQFYCSVSGSDATLKKVNRWNETKRFSRSYIDAEGDPCLELDLDLAGGVTTERIQSFFRTCRLSLSAWRTEVIN
jgi:hypothetical protein